MVESTKSFNYDWDAFDPNTMTKPPIKPIDQWLKQEDFNLTPDYFKGTPIETLNEYLVSNYNVCRGRIMNMRHKSSLSWHYDDSPRLHIPTVSMILLSVQKRHINLSPFTSVRLCNPYH